VGIGGEGSNARTARVAIASTAARGDASTLTADAVVARVSSIYLAEIKRCYRDALKVDPTAHGRMSLSLTVDATGRTVRVTASNVAENLADCVQSRMRGWTFPVPKDKDGNATESSFELQLDLSSG
jgi:hypothetical protein